MENSLSILLKDKGTDVYNISPDASVTDAVRMMNDRGVGALLVVADDRPVGMFTERDVLRRVVDAGREPSSTKVADVMTRELVTVRPGTTVQEAMGIVTEKRCRHLPVMDGETLCGMVSIGDLIRWTTRKQAIHIQDLVNYITGRYPA